MSELSVSVADYLRVRRALGVRLERAEKLLGQFCEFCAEGGVNTLTTEVALAWATLPAGSKYWHAQRLSVVRSFARWLAAHDPATEVPPPDALGSAPTPRATPFLYTDAEIAVLMGAADRLRYPISRLTYRTLVGLLATTGMRVGEAIRLDRDDIDWVRGCLRIERSKFGKSRDVVIHPTTLEALSDYASRRDALLPRPRDPSFLLSSAGTRLIYCNVSSLFHRLVAWAGLRPRSSRCRPRLHDLRHAFAVRTLVEWHTAGVDVEARLPALSTYLGHVDPKSTYWYLSASPELLGSALQRVEGPREVDS